MGNLYNKTNAPYLIAGTLATLALLASGTLAVAPYVAFLSPIAAFNVALPVALSLSILSTLILALSCKMISKNRKMEAERNKFAEKEQELKQQFESKVQELENKIALGEKAKEAVNKEVKNQSNRLTREKQDLESKVKKLNDEKEQLKAGNKNALDKLQNEKAESEQKVKGLEGKVEQLEKQQADAQEKLNQKDRELVAKVRELEGTKKKLRDTEQQLNKITLEKEAGDKQVEELTREKQGLESEVKRLNEEMEWSEEPQEELYDESKGKGGDENKNEEMKKEVDKEIEHLKACHKMTSKNVDSYKQNEKHSSENSNIDKALFDKSLKAEEKFNENINKCEETLNTLERSLLQINTVQEQANLLAMTNPINEHVPEFEKITKNEFVNELPSSSHMSTPKIKNSTQHRTKPPRKSPEKKYNDENKENSGLQNQKSSNASFGNPSSSLFKNRTNNLGSSLNSVSPR